MCRLPFKCHGFHGEGLAAVEAVPYGAVEGKHAAVLDVDGTIYIYKGNRMSGPLTRQRRDWAKPEKTMNVRQK
jgi:hypothetical protein